ncbi:hypothetical protein AVEN_68595-1 [Araneus ventricosus]|uniref:Uncharacterized protein n=1 Tax=Araneus ventricosus TaxID=182803 RepID=A0A4Y2QXZ8_ARAVE|nr:hypothetical protein AVEN_68595-1 [Araneus ventricosus]
MHYRKTGNSRGHHSIPFGAPRTKTRRRCVSDENRTVEVENPTSIVFHSVIKLKYDLGEGEQASLTKAKTARGGLVLKPGIAAAGSAFWILRE